MKVSIITVCYNSEKTIEKTIKSVLQQGYSNIEYILVDGASKDNTMSIIKGYEEKFTGRMKYISEPDQGIYDAMNKGIRMATGDIIGIVNSDDWLEEDAIEKVVAVASSDHEYEIIYGMIRIWEVGKVAQIRWHSIDFIKKQMIMHPACFVKRAVYEQFGVFSYDYKICADYELLLRYSENEKINFTPVYEILSNFVTGGASSGIDCLLETNEIQYKYGCISKAQYLRIKFRLTLSKWKNNLLKSK